VVNSFEALPNDFVKNDISVVRPLIHNAFDEYHGRFQPKEEDWVCERYVFKTLVKHLHIQKLLEEISWSDIVGRHALSSCVYLLNTRNNVIYHLYDDRGLDVVSDDIAVLEPIYIEF